MKPLYGVVCATITPMDKNGGIDITSLRNLCDYLVENGINCIYPNGTNGEGLLLSQEERQLVAETMTKHNAGRMTVYIQCTAMTEGETASHMSHAEAIGSDGAGIMTPVFFRQDETALEQYYDRLLGSVGSAFPLYVYNIPSHSNNDVVPALLGRLMNKYDNLRGIKYSAPDLMRFEDYLACAARPVDALIGCDSLFLQCLVSGGVGTVSGPAMVFAKRFATLYRQFKAGDYEGALHTQSMIVRTDRALASIPGIPAIKAMLAMQGVLTCDKCRDPFRSLSIDEKKTLSAELDIYNRE